MTNQNELVRAEVSLEKQMLARFPAAEQEELAGFIREYGADPDRVADGRCGLPQPSLWRSLTSWAILYVLVRLLPL